MPWHPMSRVQGAYTRSCAKVAPQCTITRQVIYGIDYTADQRARQHALLRDAILAHVAAAPESLLVVEEYDKLDCDSRALFRQLLENPQVANVSMARCTVVHDQ